MKKGSPNINISHFKILFKKTSPGYHVTGMNKFGNVKDIFLILVF